VRRSDVSLALVPKNESTKRARENDWLSSARVSSEEGRPTRLCMPFRILRFWAFESQLYCSGLLLACMETLLDSASLGVEERLSISFDRIGVERYE
jgi:hypothetical protein